MIKDRDIDLTMEFKFRGQPEFMNAAYKTKQKLFGKNYTFRSRYISPSSFLPWNVRPITNEDDLKMRASRTRSYGDRMSDEFGETLRVTESNHIWAFNSDYPEVLEEFFFEFLGKLPYVALAVCHRCGRRTLYSSKLHFAPILCKGCNRYPVPWESTTARLTLS